ncbi:MAG TPA: AbrB/MazE/SpoVT family DNA-binding domain-containing protein [Chloroflexi bacterium]|nr:AbrB/MazE/SpoVT family DNA-binding domain-containing protein [Chloroflexota bacterium]
MQNACQMEASQMIIAKVGRRGQITIPREVRRWLNIREGDRVTFIRRNGEVILQPLTKTLFDLRGSVPVSAPQDFTAIRQQVVKAHAHEVVKDEA